MSLRIESKVWFIQVYLWQIRRTKIIMHIGVVFGFSLEVFHFRDSLITIFDNKFKAILVKLLKQSKDSTENVFVAAIWMIAASSVLGRSLLLFQANWGFLGRRWISYVFFSFIRRRVNLLEITQLLLLLLFLLLLLVLGRCAKLLLNQTWETSWACLTHLILLHQKLVQLQELLQLVWIGRVGQIRRDSYLRHIDSSLLQTWLSPWGRADIIARHRQCRRGLLALHLHLLLLGGSLGRRASCRW